MNDDINLQKLARQAIRSGRVPRHKPDRPWGSSGNGADCPICHQPVLFQEIGYELEFARSSNQQQPTTGVLVHVACFRAWNVVRLEARGDRATLSGANEANEMA